MKKNLKYIIILFSFLIPFSVLAVRNPAALYCQRLGYKYVIKSTPEGQYGVCELPNNKSCKAWEFLWGECGKEYSYCSKIGLEIKTVKDPKKCASLPLSSKCGVCVLKDNTEIEVTKLMDLELKGGVCGDGKCVLGENYKNCPTDCPSGSSDNYCDKVKDGICDPDCLPSEDSDCKKIIICGNGKCEEQESFRNCPIDCPSGSKDNYCDKVRDGICDPDCLPSEDPDCETKTKIKPQQNTIRYFLLGGVIVIISLLILFIVWKKKKKKEKEKK